VILNLSEPANLVLLFWQLNFSRNGITQAGEDDKTKPLFDD